MKKCITLAFGMLSIGSTALGSGVITVKKRPDVPTSRQLIEKFKQLVTLNQEKPNTIASELYSQTFQGYAKELDDMFLRTNKSGLATQCQEILDGTSISFKNLKGFFESLIDPNTLRMIAYMQSTYGKGQPNRYYPNNILSADNPVIGSYKASRIEPITVTAYGFLDIILNLIDTISAKLSATSSLGQTYIERIKQLESNLDKAIAISEAGEDTTIITDITKTDPKMGYAPTLEAEFDIIANKLKSLVKSGNGKIVRELEQLFETYK